MLLNTSLLREKFIITEKDSSKKPVIATGNRILLPMISYNGEIQETIVIRTHSMHMALRLSSVIIQEFYDLGPVMHRQRPMEWDIIWRELIGDYERLNTPETWCAIYHKGKPIFKYGEYHSFLDVMEQCDAKNRDEYDRSIQIAIDAFKSAGRDVDIDHQINIGMVIGAHDRKIRTGLILRAPYRTTTFNVIIEDKLKDDRVDPHQMLPRICPSVGLSVASYFLEAIQLSVTAGFLEATQKANKSLMNTKGDIVLRRIGKLNNLISRAESIHHVRYRPEKPDFNAIRKDATAMELQNKDND